MRNSGMSLKAFCDVVYISEPVNYSPNIPVLAFSLTTIIILDVERKETSLLVHLCLLAT